MPQPVIIILNYTPKSHSHTLIISYFSLQSAWLHFFPYKYRLEVDVDVCSDAISLSDLSVYIYYFLYKKNEYIHTWVSAIVIPKELREKNDVHEIGRDFSTWLFCTFSFQTSRPLFLIFWVCYCTDGYKFLPSQEMQSERKEKEWIWREKGKVKRKNA